MKPQMSLIFGIDNLQTKGEGIIDQRYTEIGFNDGNNTLDEKQLPITWGQDNCFDLLYLFNHNTRPIQSLILYEALQWDAEDGVPSVIGLRTFAGPREDYCLRALGMIDEKYLTSGYQVIPPENLDENPMAEDLAKRVNVPSDYIYQQGFWSDVPSWIASVQFLFKYIGLKVEDKELKWMLYWQWS